LCKTGERQSPIDLELKVSDDEDSKPLPIETDWARSRKNYDFTSFTVENNGHTVQLGLFKTASGIPARFYWQERDQASYVLEQLHFHWGEDDMVGSEHSINNNSYSMEMHLVHYRRDGGDKGGFPTFKAALASGEKDALAVVALFLDAARGTDRPSKALKNLIPQFDKVTIGGDHTKVKTNLYLGDILKSRRGFTYHGSLTTPPCTEVVSWLVLTDHVSISSEDVNAFRELITQKQKDSTKGPNLKAENVTKNYRIRRATANGQEVRVVSLGEPKEPPPTTTTTTTTNTKTQKIKKKKTKSSGPSITASLSTMISTLLLQNLL